MGIRQPEPKALAVILRPGAALYPLDINAENRGVAFTISRKSTVLGRPNPFGSGSNSSIICHS